MVNTPEQTLAALRRQIDRIDHDLAQLLIARMEVVREVGALKTLNWPRGCHIRPGREGRMHREIASRFIGTPITPLTGLAIWRQIIGGSANIESPLSVNYLAAYPEHYFLAREYFGLHIATQEIADLAEALARLQQGSCNLLLLPAPPHHDGWRHAATLADHGLRIFAALPLVAEPLPQAYTSALALAAIETEDSGDDLSYFLEADGRISIHDGFLTERPGTRYLGSHPKPITL